MQAQISANIYDPLPEASALRLVVLEPGCLGDAIVCRLVQSRHIQANPQYEALSYVWGDPLDKTNILLNELEVPVTVNLAAALRHLRRSDTTRTLWIDALCINQGDFSERSEQVRRMTDIYRHAQRTLAWLGEWPDPDIPDVTPVSVQNFLHRAVELSSADEMSYDSIIVQNDAFGCYLQVAQLLESSWFMRVWVLQEAAVAREVTFVSGQTTFSWDVLMEGFSAIGNMRDPPHMISVMKRGSEVYLKSVTFCRRFFQNVEYWQDFSRAPLPDRLLSLLLLSNGQAATDQRDHLYALLSLAGQAEELQQETSLTVDYTRDPEEVLTTLAVYLLKSTQDLSMLYGATYQTALDVPSWVPTWRGGRMWNLARYFNPNMPLIRPRNGTPPKIFFSCDEKSIMIKGHIVGRVTDVGRPAEKEANDRPSVKALFEDWERDILWPLEEDFPDAYVRALVGDAVDQAPDTDRGFTATEIWCQTLFHSSVWDEEWNDENNFEARLYAALLGHAQVDEANLERLNPILDDFCAMDVSRLHGGAPFATSSGLFGFFDNAHLLEEYPNATICLFLGCKVSFILGGGPEEYTLLGPCYLQPFVPLKTVLEYPDWVNLI